jgi:hypothetical protein
LLPPFLGFEEELAGREEEILKILKGGRKRYLGEENFGDMRRSERGRNGGKFYRPRT